jgi:hypothetical protein
VNLARALQDHSVVALALLSLVLGSLCSYLLRKLNVMRDRIRVAERAAEEAARAAALAAPGGIDPEVVLELLRDGRPPTLDNVYALMQQRDQTSAAPEEQAETEVVAQPV